MTSREIVLPLLVSFLASSCALFEPREPEPPSQTSSDFRPPIGPDFVITNLQSAIAQKNLQNYISCFSNPARSQRGFTFIPTTVARAQYSILDSWDYDKEQAYMNNLISRKAPNGFSSLLLTLKSQFGSSDSVVYTYGYTFTFEHNDPGFPHSSAVGELQFTLGPDNTGFWSIQRWVDIPTTSPITWSSFKGWFSPQ
jgi:hypothetical protein